MALANLVFQLAVLVLEILTILFAIGAIRMFWAAGVLFLMATCVLASVAVFAAFIGLSELKPIRTVLTAIHVAFLLFIVGAFFYTAAKPAPYLGPGGM